MAYAGSRMADALLRAAAGEKGVIEPTFVQSPLYADQGCDFFSSKVELGPEGVKTIHPVGKVSDYENDLLTAALKDLAKNITKASLILLSLFRRCFYLLLRKYRARNLSRLTRRFEKIRWSWVDFRNHFKEGKKSDDTVGCFLFGSLCKMYLLVPYFFQKWC